jgi:hypothetical protein
MTALVDILGALLRVSTETPDSAGGAIPDHEHPEATAAAQAEDAKMGMDKEETGEWW